MLTNIKYFEISFVFWLQKVVLIVILGIKTNSMSSNECKQNKPVEKPEFFMTEVSLN